MRAAWVLNATDAGVNLDRLPAPPISDSGWDFLMGCQPWVMIDHAAAWLGLEPCPICGDFKAENSLGRRSYCAGCDHTGQDGRIAFPGEPIGSCLDPDWQAEPTVYDPDDELAGGVEAKPAKLRRGVARSRRAG